MKTYSETCIRTFTGRMIDLMDPQPEDIHLHDIAHMLALTNRFSGATYAPYSVAQHSVLASHMADDDAALYALLHDASEAYLGDIVRPLKRTNCFDKYRILEAKMMDCILDKYGVKVTKKHIEHVREIDNRLMIREANDLLPTQEGAKFIPSKDTILPWDWKLAETEFISTYEGLTATK